MPIIGSLNKYIYNDLYLTDEIPYPYNNWMNTDAIKIAKYWIDVEAQGKYNNFYLFPLLWNPKTVTVFNNRTYLIFMLN